MIQMPLMIDYTQGLNTAAYERGSSYIAAAQLMLSHMPDEVLQQEADNLRHALVGSIDDDNFTQMMANAPKDMLLQEYLNYLAAYWQSHQDSCTPDKLKLLETTLVHFFAEDVYNYEAVDEKAFSKIKNDLDNAENHVNWTKRQILENKMDGATRRAQPISSFSAKQTEIWLRINDNPPPKWFTKSLSPWEQNYLRARVRDWENQKDMGVRNLGDFLGPVPTTIRRYPGAPNAYVCQLMFDDEKGKRVSFEKVRSGFVAPVKMSAGDEKDEITLANLEQLVAVAIDLAIQKQLENKDVEGKALNLPILLQTLHTPPFQPPGFGKGNNTALKNAFADLQKELKTEAGVEAFLKRNQVDTGRIKVEKVNLMYTNRPVNKGRVLSFITAPFTLWRRPETKKTERWIKNEVKRQIKAAGGVETDELKEIKAAYQAYRDYRSKGNFFNTLFSSSEKNSNAEVAAMEQLLLSKLGGVRLGSCVSGKDREEEIEEIAIAMDKFYHLYGHFPPPNNVKNEKQLKQRELFHDLIAREFLAGFGQKIANENAKGCFGLKSVKDVFGSTICQRILQVAEDVYGIKPDEFNTVDGIQQIAKLNKISSEELQAVADPEAVQAFRADLATHMQQQVIQGQSSMRMDDDTPDHNRPSKRQAMVFSKDSLQQGLAAEEKRENRKAREFSSEEMAKALQEPQENSQPDKTKSKKRPS